MSILTRDLIIACFSCLFAYVVDWSDIKLKIVVLWNALYQIVIFIVTCMSVYFDFSALWYWSYLIALVCFLFVSSIVTHQLFRPFTNRSQVTIGETYFYGLYLPRGCNGVFTCLFSFIYSGLCVYGNGIVWRFKRGNLVRSRMRDVANKPIVWIDTNVRCCQEFDRQLDSVVGCRWRCWSTCFDRLQIFQPISKILKNSR